MTVKEYQKKLDKRLSEISFTNQTLRECVNDTHADYVQRIFVNGRRSNLTQIGQYKSEAYKKRRVKRGRQVATVNLVFEGRLFTNVSNSLRRVTDKIMVNGATTKFEADKIDWLTDRYGKDVWEISKIELRNLTKCLSDLTLKIFTK